MKHTSKLLAALLALALALCALTGCGGKDSGTAETTLTEVRPSDIFTGDFPRVWFGSDADELAKDKRPRNIVIVYDDHIKYCGKVDYYDGPLELTYGDIAKMSDEEIIARVESGDIRSSNGNEVTIQDIPITLHVYTDDSGNNARKEEITPEQNVFTVGQTFYPTPIYDVFFGGYYSYLGPDTGISWFTKCDQNTYFMLDTPDTPGIEVD